MVVHEALVRCLSRSRRCKSRTGRPKVIKGDCLASQRTLVDPILNVSTITGAPLPSFHWRSSWKADSLETLNFSPLYSVWPSINIVESETESALASPSNFTIAESNFSKRQEVGSMENNDKTLKEKTLIRI
ncbi:hypothetical protein CR513_42733, partial [Mucuna pruriens]